MPFNVRLETRNGQLLGEVVGMRGDFLPAYNDEAFPLVRLIDPYDDTVFNRLQAKVLLQEWVLLEEPSETNKQHRDWREVKRLAEECLAQPLRYLRFVGD